MANKRPKGTYWTRDGQWANQHVGMSEPRFSNQSPLEGRTPGDHHSARCTNIEKKSLHFFHTIFVLEALAGLNFFLAVNKVLGGSLALGRLFRLFTQLGMYLCAGTGSGTNRTRCKLKRTSSTSSSSAASASPATSSAPSSSWGSGSDTLDSSGASACSVPATRDEKSEEMLIACCNLNSELVRSHVVRVSRQSPAA